MNPDIMQSMKYNYTSIFLVIILLSADQSKCELVLGLCSWILHIRIVVLVKVRECFYQVNRNGSSMKIEL